VGLRRFLKPSVILRRKALRSGVFGGDRTWLRVFVTMFFWRRIKALFGFGDPQPVFVEEAGPGHRFVVAHEDNSTSRRKRRKADKKATKKANKKAAKVAKKANKETITS
jgi:hypothetical protein